MTTCCRAWTTLVSRVKLIHHQQALTSLSSPHRGYIFTISLGGLRELLGGPRIYSRCNSSGLMVVLLTTAVLFQLADPLAYAQGGNVSVDLSAVTVQARCVPAASNITGPDAQNFYEIVGTLPNGCTAKSYAPTTNIGTWFGWGVTTPFECVLGINPNETDSTDPGDFYRPVALSFLKTTSMYSMVFCYSTLEEHDVVATLEFGQGISNVSDKSVVKSLGYGPNG
jgi:hypothetical protein